MESDTQKMIHPNRLSVLKNLWGLPLPGRFFCFFLLREGEMWWHEAYRLLSERVKRTLKPKPQDSGQFLLADVLVCVLYVELVPAIASLPGHGVLVNMSHAGSYLHSAVTKK